MQINRDKYLQQLIHACGNQMIKVVTGMRRCGKSYLRFTLFHNHLLAQGVEPSHLIEVDLEDRLNIYDRYTLDTRYIGITTAYSHRTHGMSAASFP